VNTGTQGQQSQASPYLAFYGLAREPFATTIEFDLFYLEPTRTQRLDILHHLTQYNDELLLVTGPEGSGKSTLLQQYIARASETWEVVRVEASGGIDERNLIQQIYHQLELNFRGATHPELLEQLEYHLDSLLHNARQGVLLVDDAHLLTITALQRILQLASLRSFTNKPLLRVIAGRSPAGAICRHPSPYHRPATLRRRAQHALPPAPPVRRPFRGRRTLHRGRAAQTAQTVRRLARATQHTGPRVVDGLAAQQRTPIRAARHLRP